MIISADTKTVIVPCYTHTSKGICNCCDPPEEISVVGQHALDVSMMEPGDTMTVSVPEHQGYVVVVTKGE